jgi:hypothetical protein
LNEVRIFVIAELVGTEPWYTVITELLICPIHTFYEFIVLGNSADSLLAG